MLKTVSTQLALASDTLPEVLAKGNTTGGTDLAVSSGDDITFADNSKAIFGAGSDLSIYSDGATGQVLGNVNVTGTGTFSSTIASGGLTATGQIATNVQATVTSFNAVCSAGDQTATSLKLTSGRTDTFYHVQAFNGNTTECFRVEANGNTKNTNNSYGALSDAKLKENIVDASPKLADLMQVKVRNYNLIGETTKQIGVVAQELETVFPSMVDETEDRDVDGNFLETTTKGVKYSVFVPMLIKGIQEQQAIIEALTARIEALETLN